MSAPAPQLRKRALLATLFLLSACSAADGRSETSTDIEHVAQLARLYGVVRYFHPSGGVELLDWDRFAVHAVERVLDAPDSVSVPILLRELFAPIVVGFDSSSAFSPNGGTGPSTPGPYLAWQHDEFGPGLNPGSGRSQRSRFGEGSITEDRLFDQEIPFGARVDLVFGTTGVVSVPLTLREADALPRVAEGSHLAALLDTLAAMSAQALSADRRAVRLAAVLVAWNAFIHFHPYGLSAGTDPDEALMHALRIAGTTDGVGGLEQALHELARPWQDGHVSVVPLGPEPDRTGVLPFVTQVADGRLFVTGSAHPSVLVGDEIVALGHEAAPDALTRVISRIQGTSRRRLAIAAGDAVREGLRAEPVVVRLRRAGVEREVEIHRVHIDSVPPVLYATWQHPSPAEVQPGVWYVDLFRTPVAAFDSAVGQLSAADAVIFDLRAYPAGTFPLLGHLTDAALPGPPHCSPRGRGPFQDSPGTCEPSGFELQPRSPRFRGQTVFLSSSRSISAAETLLMMVRHHGLGRIVGDTTAGANGGLDWFRVPGRFQIYMTATRTVDYDGRSFQGRGVAPDLVVPPTAESLARGRDEQLEAAIQLVSGGSR